MLFRLLLRIGLKLFGSHCLFPIAVVFALESLAQLPENGYKFAAVWQYWEKNWLPLTFHGIAFALIVAWVANERMVVTLNRIGVLDEYLKNATNYFAIATIRLPEWFQPATQVYFAKILSYQNDKPKTSPSFQQRVMLFFSDSDLAATKSTAFDEFPAACFNQIHALHQIPLGFLDRVAIFDLLAGLAPDQRAALKWHRWYVLRIHRIFTKQRLRALGRNKWIPSWLILRRPQHLAFAVVTFGGNTRKVLLFVKRKRDLEITELQDDRIAPAYLALAKEIRRGVFPLTPQTSFDALLHPTVAGVKE